MKTRKKRQRPTARSGYWNRKLRRRAKSQQGSSDLYQNLEDRRMLAQFVGTEGVDIIEIGYSNGRPATIEINGTVHDNPDQTLVLDLEQENSTQLENDVVTIEGGDSHQVELSTGVTIISDFVAIDIGFRSLTLNLGDGSHVINEDGSFFPESDLAPGITATVNTGAGDDVLILNGGAVSANLGAGDDLVLARDFTGSGSIGAGEGYDVLDFDRELDYETYLGILSLDPTIRFDANRFGGLGGRTEVGASFGGFEKYVAPTVVANEYGINASPNIFKAQADHHTLVVGATTWSVPFDESLDTVEFVNFDRIEGRQNTSVYVAETAYRVTIEQVDWVNLGGDFQNGDTSKVKHVVKVDGAESMVISNSSSTEPGHVSIGYDSVHGLTQIGVLTANVAHLNLSSSNTASDQFYASEFDGHLILFGNGGDDEFYIGNHNRDISITGKVINVVGGEGDDFVFVDDRPASIDRHFRVSDTWIHFTGDSPDQRFQGIWHGEVERVDLHTNAFAKQFLISASPNTQINVFSTKQDRTFEETFFLLDAPVDTLFTELGNDTYSWWFGNDLNDPGLIYLQLLPAEV